MNGVSQKNSPRVTNHSRDWVIWPITAEWALREAILYQTGSDTERTELMSQRILWDNSSFYFLTLDAFQAAVNLQNKNNIIQ